MRYEELLENDEELQMALPDKITWAERLTGEARVEGTAKAESLDDLDER